MWQKPWWNKLIICRKLLLISASLHISVIRVNEVLDLHEMLSSLTSLYETMENVLFKWVPVHEKILVFADKTQLNRLFTNLLQNALEACHDQEICVISLSEELMEDRILIRISDNGEGIPEQMRSKIFIPNFTTKSSGTGLGLAMSKTIVEQAKGRIWFETAEDEGTTFFVELPVYDETAGSIVHNVGMWNCGMRNVD